MIIQYYDCVGFILEMQLVFYKKITEILLLICTINKMKED
jgi:hypothetical protein